MGSVCCMCPPLHSMKVHGSLKQLEARIIMVSQSRLWQIAPIFQ